MENHASYSRLYLRKESHAARILSVGIYFLALVQFYDETSAFGADAIV